MRIRMLRNVLVEGEHRAAGEVVEVEDRLAETLIQWGRAEAAEEVEVGEGQALKRVGGQKSASEELETATRPAAQRRRKGEL